MNGITEITETPAAPAIEPEVIGGHRIDTDNGGITTVGSVGITAPAVVELNGKDQNPVEQWTEGKPVAPEDAPIVKPDPEDMIDPNDPLDLGSIPGVKEVTVREIPADDAQPDIKDMVGPDGKPLTASANAFVREMLRGGFINQFIKKYSLEGIDIEKEAELIKEKKSHLSASKRKAVMALVEIRTQQKELMKLVGQSLKAKDSIDEMNTETTDETKAAENESQRQLAEKLSNGEQVESTPEVEKVLEECMVNYTPEEEDGTIKLEVHE